MNTNTKIRFAGLFSFLALVVVSLSVATQFVASGLGYHASLGNKLIGNLYNPFSLIEWVRFYPYAPNTYNHAFLIVMFGGILSLVLIRVVVGMKTRSAQRHEGSHGTAAFATWEQVNTSGLIHDKPSGGVYCGGYYNEKSGRIHYLQHTGPEHVALFAPTGSGKGVGLILPTLLSYLESVFVLDIKGENYALSAGWRKKHTNSHVLRFDPANEAHSCSWNPLEEIRHGSRYQISDTQNIALMVMDEDGKGLKGHWLTAAHEMLFGVILHALYKAKIVGRVPSLLDCALMLTGTGEFGAPMKEKNEDDFDPKPLESLFEEMMNVSLDGNDAGEEAQQQINSIGTRFYNTPSKELGSIISTALNALTLYRDPIIGKNTSRSDFKISDLMDNERAVSLYFITNPNDLVRMKPLARLLITRIVASLCGNMEYEEGRSKTVHTHKLLMMLDEFPVLGKMEAFERALAYIRGYGIKAYIIMQDVQQLYQSYSNYESILSNCHIQLAYAPNNQQTAELLSKMCGQTTVIKEHISTSGKRFGLTLNQVSTSFQESSRQLMTPDEVKHLPMMHAVADAKVKGEMLIFMAGMNVIKGTQTPYFLDPVFDRRSKIAPPKDAGFVPQVTTESAEGFVS